MAKDHTADFVNYWRDLDSPVTLNNRLKQAHYYFDILDFFNNEPPPSNLSLESAFFENQLKEVLTRI